MKQKEFGTTDEEKALRGLREVSGRKNRSVFDRYNIVSDADLRAAADAHKAFLDTQAKPSSHDLATITHFPTKKGLAQ